MVEAKTDATSDLVEDEQTQEHIHIDEMVDEDSILTHPSDNKDAILEVYIQQVPSSAMWVTKLENILDDSWVLGPYGDTSTTYCPFAKFFMHNQLTSKRLYYDFVTIDLFPSIVKIRGRILFKRGSLMRITWHHMGSLKNIIIIISFVIYSIDILVIVIICNFSLFLR